MLLENNIFRRHVVFVGNGSGLQGELLWSLKLWGSGDQVGRETAGQEVARGAGGEC